MTRRVLVALTYGFSIRAAVPTGMLKQLAQQHEVVVGLVAEDPVLRAELVTLDVETVVLPPARLEQPYRRFRRQIELVHQDRLASATWPILRRRERDAVPQRLRPLWHLRTARDEALVRLPGAAARLERAEREVIEDSTNVEEFGAFLRHQRIEGVVSFTPYHDQDFLLLWAARASGIPSLTSVISFDNPTTRGRTPVRSERLLVWNDINAAELRRAYPELTPDRLAAIGAAQFDLHHDQSLLIGRDDWAAELGLDADRPVILYGAGPASLVPAEPALVAMLDDAIELGSIPGRPQLLVRTHPVDTPATWDGLESSLRHGRIVRSWGSGGASFQTWPTRAELVQQMSTLSHADVHISICSSMALDGAMFDKPHISPTFVPEPTRAEARRVTELYAQEHWQPIASRGGVEQPADAEQLVDAVNRSLEDPSRGAAGRAALRSEVVANTDGCSTQRLVAEVRSLFG